MPPARTARLAAPPRAGKRAAAGRRRRRGDNRRAMPASLAELLARPDHVLLRVQSGSHAYGLATADSDVDERGIFALPAAAYVALSPPLEHLQDARGDVVFYGLRKFLALASAANPSALELLFPPPGTVLQQAPPAQLLFARRQLFVTQRCVDSHVGYARAQIQRARGQNKWINNPQPEAPPRREEFCFVILGPWPGAAGGVAGEPLPLRPRPLLQSGIDLGHYHCAALERVPRTYRLYHYGAAAKGVFRDGNLVCESIPIEHEQSHLRGLLVFDQPGYDKAKLDHAHYWQWRRQRNDARWRTQEAGEIDYDAKNMMHTFRLLLSASAILRERAPRVRFDGADRDFLLRVRAGTFAYAELVDRAEAMVGELTAQLEHAELAPEPDAGAVDELLRAVTRAWEAGRG